eukprot:gnl/Hemi2/411_TR135_c0_g1_i1.p1 gnl/Hemi2/411_TR135_c0_g1~~gnl/Hemi2/411_TR135_c0_g1_i1.p1  ORF type:complete len:354 (+),score=85.71 gnl/Hemi2/411_TR135_c0_g1_i1:365-1426(+)
MGCTSCKRLDLPAHEDVVHSNINKMLSREKAKQAAALKLLLLGPGESGKSTVFKQVRVIHLQPYSAKDLATFREAIRMQTVKNMQLLIEQADLWHVQMATASQRNSGVVKGVDLNKESFMTPAVAVAITELWTDPAIRSVWDRRSAFQINDTAPYFFDSATRVVAPDYVPSHNDIIHARIQTHGIVDQEFSLQGQIVRLIDVGGQRPQRRKWLYCFEGVTAVIYVASLSEYDQVLAENSSINRMKESLDLFAELVDSKWFKNSIFIVFLNKRDLFEEKIKRVDLRGCFADYTGGCNYERALEYIHQQFLAIAHRVNRQVYIKVTCATDQKNVDDVFTAIRHHILVGGLTTGGF